MRRHARYVSAWAVAAMGSLAFAACVEPVADVEAPPMLLDVVSMPDPLQPGDPGAIRAILEAPDPSAAIGAYARATGAGSDRLAADRAFVRRMVEFSLPEMAESQAREVAAREPTAALAQAVVAYMCGKRGETIEAMIRIAIAASTQPDDPFVQRTAGQLIAWYDTLADRSQFSDSIRAEIEAVRASLAERALYKEAYERARDAYLAAAPPSATPPEPGAPVPALPSVTAPSTTTTTTETTTTYTTAPVYEPAPYVVEYPVYYPVYTSCYPAAGWYSSWWWPSCWSTTIVIGGRWCGDGGRRWRDRDHCDWRGRRWTDDGDVLVRRSAPVASSITAPVAVASGGSPATSRDATTAGAMPTPSVAPMPTPTGPIMPGVQSKMNRLTMVPAPAGSPARPQAAAGPGTNQGSLSKVGRSQAMAPSSPAPYLVPSPATGSTPGTASKQARAMRAAPTSERQAASMPAAVRAPAPASSASPGTVPVPPSSRSAPGVQSKVARAQAATPSQAAAPTPLMRVAPARPALPSASLGTATPPQAIGSAPGVQSKAARAAAASSAPARVAPAPSAPAAAPRPSAAAPAPVSAPAPSGGGGTAGKAARMSPTTDGGGGRGGKRGG